MPHYSSFLPLIPDAVKIDFVGLELYNDSLYQIADKKEIIVQRVQEMVAARSWDGVILTASPLCAPITPTACSCSRPSTRA